MFVTYKGLLEQIPPNYRAKMGPFGCRIALSDMLLVAIPDPLDDLDHRIARMNNSALGIILRYNARPENRPALYYFSTSSGCWLICLIPLPFFFANHKKSQA